MNRVATTAAAACALTVVIALGSTRDAGAQGGLIFYPAAGQSQEQLNRDRAECQQWATGQTGFDPAVAGQQAAHAQSQVAGSFSSPPPSGGEGAMLRGAAGGAIIGGIAGNPGRGAAAGALFGGVRRASASQDRARWEQQQQQQRQAQSQQIAAQYQQGLDTWNRAIAACMQARNYQVS